MTTAAHVVRSGYPPLPLQRLATLLRHPATVGGVVAALGALPPLLVPAIGTDLAAQAAWTQFAAGHPGSAYDLGWYAGTYPGGYSLLAPYVFAMIGLRVGMGLATVAAAALVGDCFRAVSAQHAVAGAAWAALALDANLLAGRATFALGLVAAAAAVRLLLPAPASPRRVLIAAGCALVSSATSPVDGLFVGVVAAALLLNRRRYEGCLLAGAAAVPLAAMAALFPNPGVQPDGLLINTVAPLGTSLLVALLVPRRTVQFAAGVYAAGVIAAFLVPTPVGSNVERLALMLGAPVIVALARRRRAAVAALLLIAVWQLHQPLADVLGGSDPGASTAYNAGIVAELHLLHADTARVEAVPEVDHWESVLLAVHVPLARGWERQLDVDRNPIFYAKTLRPSAYHRWLLDNAVGYVAVSDRPPDWAGAAEARLVRSDLPWLPRIWRDAHWSIYRVQDAEPLASGAVTVVRSTPARIILRVARPSDFLLRVRWSPWLTLSGGPGCLTSAGQWTRVHALTAGTFTVSGPYRFPRGTRCSATGPH